jgi:hypothetical protein
MDDAEEANERHIQDQFEKTVDDAILCFPQRDLSSIIYSFWKPYFALTARRKDKDRVLLLPSEHDAQSCHVISALFSQCTPIYANVSTSQCPDKWSVRLLAGHDLGVGIGPAKNKYTRPQWWAQEGHYVMWVTLDTLPTVDSNLITIQLDKNEKKLTVSCPNSIIRTNIYMNILHGFQMATCRGTCTLDLAIGMSFTDKFPLFIGYGCFSIETGQ